MDGIILYGSVYGATRRYALALAARTGLPALPFFQAPPLQARRCIVYLGGLYAGGVVGLKKTLGALSPTPGQRMLLATVGLADPHDAQTQQNIRRSLTGQLPQALAARAELFFLRGGIDYGALSPAHRTALCLLRLRLRGKPRAQWTKEDRDFMDTYGRRADFVDPATLAPLIAALQEGPA